MTAARWLPDPAAGRWLRALAISLVIACAAVTCAQGGGAGRGVAINHDEESTADS